MSQSTGSSRQESSSRFSLPEDASIADVFGRLYHLPVIAALMAFMLWVRLQSYDEFVIDGEYYFTGNDPWYHYRETTYTVMNYPFTMPYDIWTRYPEGTLAGQFGTLWDQLVATVILIVGLGSPTEAQAGAVMLVATAVMATLCAIPTYYLARRFVPRVPALFGVLLLALIPGQFLNRSLVGSYQHHAAETFFMTVAVLAMLVALSVAGTHKPVWELVVDRDFEAMRTPAIYSALAGFATALYLYVWQPGLLLIGIFGIFFLVTITSDVVHDDSPEPAIFVGAVSMTVTGLLLVIPLEEFSFSVTAYSFSQIFLPLGVAAGCLFLGALARGFEGREIAPERYPVAVGGILAGVAAVMIVALPDIWSHLYGNFVQYVGLGATDVQATIAEAQPLLAQGQGVEPIIREYGLTLFVAIIALLGILLAPLVRSSETNHTLYAGVALGIVALFIALPAVPDVLFGLVGVPGELGALVTGFLLLVGAMYLVRYPAEEQLLVIWALFLLSATFTQLRFSYYLVIPVVVLNAIVIGKVIAYTNLDADTISEAGEKLKGIEGWQVMTVSAILIAILVPGLIVPVEAAGATGTAWQIGANAGPGEVQGWDDSLEWMSENTPYPGELEGHDNRLDYYGTVEHPGDDGYEYPEGAYGVMSWWDYGHWITVLGERIPYANPFQNNARDAANYLLAPDEEQAETVLERLNEPNEAEAQARYVMIDWQMVAPTSKFSAPVTWYDDADVEQEDFNRQVYQVTEEGALQPVTRIQTQRYYESQMVQLYEGYGSAMEPEPVVVTYDIEQIPTPAGEQLEIVTLPADPDEFIQRYDSMEEAEQAVEDAPGEAQIGGVAGIPSERVDALEHYRLVYADETPGQAPGAQQLQELQGLGVDTEETLGTSLMEGLSDDYVKTFERVPGTTVEGSGAEPGAEVQAAVEMEKPTGETFIYTQYAEADGDGEFELHLPYSTTGYDEWGPEEGYTETNVQATGPYQVVSEDGTQLAELDVSEAQVIGEDDTTPTVELESAEEAGGAGSVDGGPSEDETESDPGSVTAGNALGLVAPIATTIA
ncbi:oligosaccharyl transferase, archaeosortase A system-associated [Halorubrum vacuolatum]|uniref:dolichyl-phosphooligosaccharide-protein glycotransferase n=1 Tax=Halorubrum vacuolatum TaxID=63740 RepID=A0A238UP74_HALVU|nr:oligosaccharyl transferase, archaeosortase A system-associated [Halorubrum vacuolatum]SNR23900.1 dolichyl-diphosphooligosaccharide--protein glycosyltransferase [Halorubrum vacuolatum]